MRVTVLVAVGVDELGSGRLLYVHVQLLHPLPISLSELHRDGERMRRSLTGSGQRSCGRTTTAVVAATSSSPGERATGEGADPDEPRQPWSGCRLACCSRRGAMGMGDGAAA